MVALDGGDGQHGVVAVQVVLLRRYGSIKLVLLVLLSHEVKSAVPLAIQTISPSLFGLPFSLPFTSRYFAGWIPHDNGGLET